MSYYNPDPIPPGSKHVSMAWTVTTEDVAGLITECGGRFKMEDFERLTDEDVERITAATLDCINFEHQVAMADYTLSEILYERGVIDIKQNYPDESDYLEEDNLEEDS